MVIAFLGIGTVELVVLALLGLTLSLIALPVLLVVFVVLPQRKTRQQIEHSPPPLPDPKRR